VLAARRDGRTLIRFDLRRRRQTTVARLPARADWLTALADGSIVSATGRRLWWLRSGRVVRRVRFGGDVAGLAAWTHATAAVLTDTGDLLRVRADGGRRRVLRGARQWLLSAGPGQVLTTTTDETSPSLTVVNRRGGTTLLPWAPLAFEGADGTTAAETPWPNPTSMAVAADGSLIMVTAFGIRALVPASSERLRVAPLPERFDGQRISFFAGVAGRLTAELWRAKERRAAFAIDVQRGAGQLSLPAALPLDLYDVKLRLSAAGATTGGQTRVGQRTTLTLEEGVAALARFADTEGDEGGAVGTTIDHCRVLSPAAVQCQQFWLDAWNNPDEEEEYGSSLMPFGVVRAYVGDGAILTERDGPDDIPGPAPKLTVVAPQSQRLRELAATVTSEVAGSAKLEAWLRIGERSLALSSHNVDLFPGVPWVRRLTVDAAQARTVRAQLRRGVPVRVAVHIRVAAPVDGGTATLLRATDFTVTP
jgi:hypothetical protein